MIADAARPTLDWTFLGDVLFDNNGTDDTNSEGAANGTDPEELPQPATATVAPPVTPIYNRYRCALRREKRKTQQLQRIAGCSSRIRNVNDVLEATKNILSPAQQSFFRSQPELSAKTARGRRFTDKQVMDGLALYYQGPKAYRHLRKTFVLPSPRCLRQRIEGIQMKTGFQDWIMSIMKEKFSGAAGHEKLVSISFDEMQVRPKLNYLPSEDTVGVQDQGNVGRTSDPADHALVFMARGVTCRWKQPVGYFLSKGPTSATVMKELLEACIRKLRLAGFTVVSSVSDMGTPNQQLYRLLGVSTENPKFEVDGEEVIALFDVPHLYKCLRNTLLKQDVSAAGKTASWNDIRLFYNQEKTKQVRTAPRLTKDHIDPGPFKKMKVRYALQVFSRSVAAGLSLYTSFGK